MSITHPDRERPADDDPDEPSPAECLNRNLRTEAAVRSLSKDKKVGGLLALVATSLFALVDAPRMREGKRPVSSPLFVGGACVAAYYLRKLGIAAQWENESYLPEHREAMEEVLHRLECEADGPEAPGGMREAYTDMRAVYLDDSAGHDRHVDA